MKSSARLSVAAVLLSVGLSVSAVAGEQAGSKQAAQQLDLETATPVQLGIRYGQAAGIALLCYGLKVTPAVEKLKSRFSGTDREIFDKQAAKILAAWERTLRCEGSGGPNECKLSHTWSCQQGLKELGPSGSVIPGLVEQKVK